MLNSGKRKLIPAAKYLAWAAGIVLSGMQIWDMVGTPKSDLIARIHFSDFVIPTTVATDFQKIYALSDHDRLETRLNLADIQRDYFSQSTIIEEQDAKRILDSKTEAEETKDVIRAIQDKERSLNDRLQYGVSQLLYRFGELIREEVPNGLPSAANSLYGVWFVEVENAGDRVARNAKLKAPRAKLIQIVREGKSPEVITTDEFVELGNIEPQEMVSIVAWTSLPTSAFAAREFRVTHSAGIGDIRIYESMGPIWVWVARWWVPLILAAVWLVTVLGRAISVKEERPRNPGPDPREED